MRHPSQLDEYANSPDGIERAEIIEIHLEECEKCRRRLADISGVDLERVRSKIHGEIEVPVSSVPWFRRLPGPATAVAVFLLVLATGTTALLLTTDGREQAGPPATNPPNTTVIGIADLVAFSDRAPFELTWSVGNGDRGRLVWKSSEQWTAARVEVTGAIPVELYTVGRDLTDQYTSTDDYPLTYVGTEVDLAMSDLDVPYALLLGHPDLKEWPSTAGEPWISGDPVPVDPTHPLAAAAWGDGSRRIEFTGDGIPVLIIDGDAVFSAISLDRRSPSREELHAGGDFAIAFAAHLLPDTSPEQSLILADGFVAASEYEAAANEAAECSGSSVSLLALTDLASADLDEECRSRYLEDVATVWRIQTGALDDDEWELLYYAMLGMDEMAALTAAVPGASTVLRSQTGASITVWPRGEGWCTRTPNSEGCAVFSLWQAPGVIQVDPSISVTDDGVGTGDVHGLALDEVTDVVLSFSLGGQIGIETFGHDASLEVVAYSFSYSTDELGILSTVSAYDATGSLLGAYDFLADYCSESPPPPPGEIPALAAACSPTDG